MIRYLRFPAPALVDVATLIFEKAGAESVEAAEIARNLVEANLAGHDSHGLIRVPRYLDWLRRGYLKLGQHVSVVNENGSMVTLEGGHGFGQVLGREAVEFGLRKAEETGFSLIALRHGGHLGRIGAWAEMAAAKGFVSIHFANMANSLVVAPFGGSERRMSTAPVAIGVPGQDGDDFILDFSTARWAEGKILVAYKSGAPVPEGYLIDADGAFSDDPGILYGPIRPGQAPDPRTGPGALVAMGDHKGSGLAIACEILAGIVTGSGTHGSGNHPWNGMLSIYIRPELVGRQPNFGEAVRDYIEFVRSSRPRTAGENVLIPGDPERRSRAERLLNGIPLATDSWRSIIDAALPLGIDRATIDAIVGGDMGDRAATSAAGAATPQDAAAREGLR